MMVLAGCTSAGGSAKVVAVSLDAPATAYRGEPFSASLQVKNTGHNSGNAILSVVAEGVGAVGNGARSVHVDAGKCLSEQWSVTLSPGRFVLYGSVDGTRAGVERAVDVLDEPRPVNTADSRGSITPTTGGPC
jgi:hypothetical protein